MATLTLYLISQTILAFFATSIGLMVPGIYLTRKYLSKLEPISALLVSFCIGLALFGMQAYVFGWLNLRAGGYVYALLMLCLLVWKRKMYSLFLLAAWEALRKIPRIVMGIILFGVLIQSLQMFGNGLPLSGGTNFYRTNAYDGIFHLGLIENMKSAFPPEEPSSSGLRVVNYHYWSDLVISEQSRLFGSNSAFLFFQWTPVLLSLCTSLAVYRLIEALAHSESEQFRRHAIVIGLALLLLGADSGWLIPWLVHHQFTFTYPAIDNGPTQFLNMPHVFGKLFFYSVALLFVQWRRERLHGYLIAALVLSAVTFGLKIYFGIALALGFLFVFIWDGICAIRTNRWHLKKSVQDLMPLALSGALFSVLIGIIYLPVNSGAGGLSWYPLEWPKLFVNSENFDWTDLNYRIAIAKYLHDVPKIYLYNGILILVGMVAIYGTRMFGFFLNKKSLRLLGIDGMLFFYIPTLVFAMIGMTTLQDSSAFNVFNFFAVSMSFLVVSLGLLGAQILEKSRWIGIVVCIVLLAFGLPRSLFEIQSMIVRYRDHTDVVTITPGERDAFHVLSSSPFGASTIVATSLEDPLSMRSTYLPALSGKRVYFSGKYLLETHNQPFQEKERNIRSLFAESSFSSFIQRAKNLGITAIWVDRKTVSSPADKMLELESSKAVFANSDVLIYDIRNL